MPIIVRVLVADRTDIRDNNSARMTGAIPLTVSTRLHTGETMAITAHIPIARITTPIIGIVRTRKAPLETSIVPTTTMHRVLPMDRSDAVEESNASRIDATLFGVRIAETMTTAGIRPMAIIAEVLRTVRIFEIGTSAMILGATTAPTLSEAVHSVKSLVHAGKAAQRSKGTT
jgi:hypothetical protein